MDLKLKELSAWHLLVIMAVAFVVLVARRPDIIQNAQPWAEDGKIWMAGIYNEGFWGSLILPQNGYYQTISRISYAASLAFGLSHAALASNIIALMIRCFFIGFILSGRMSFISLKYRFIAVTYFILMPNISEGFVNITNAHWYLSMYLVAIVMSEKPNNIAWKVHDLIILVVSSLSGPFVVFIAPCLLIKRVYERGGILNAIKGVNTFDLIMAICCLVQVMAILLSPDTARSSAPLGASVGVLVKIIAYRIIGGSFIPDEIIAFMPQAKWLCAFLFCCLFIPAVYFLFRGGWRYKVAFLFPALMFGFALAKPMMSITDPQWPVFFGPGNGERYFFVTNFAFFCFTLYLANRMGVFRNIFITAILLIGVFGAIKGFHMNPMPDVGFKDDIQSFQSLPKGERMNIRINPPGWTMELIKK